MCIVELVEADFAGSFIKGRTAMLCELNSLIDSVGQGLWSDEICTIELSNMKFRGRVKANLRGQIAIYEIREGEIRTKKGAAVLPEDLYLVRPLAGVFWLEQLNIERSVEPNQICLINFGVPHSIAAIALDCVCLRLPVAPLRFRPTVLDNFHDLTKAIDPERYNLLASFLDYFGENLQRWSGDEFARITGHLYGLISLHFLKTISPHLQPASSE